MNKRKRIKLKESEVLLNKAIEIIEAVKEDEQDSLDNMPENLQDSARASQMEDCIDQLDEALEYISSALECTDAAQNGGE